ncbi:MAG: serine/threonine-protein kinase, partial [Leptolyngbyaceae cyanobacterium MO_188.B28]|nr:serine/threonine-protein kinase [Leptolyngbyaceae cyanobacterium MO_188.B28]
MSHFPDFSNQGYQVEKTLGSNRAGGRVTYLAKDIRGQQSVVIKQFQFAKIDASWSDYDAYDREIQVLRGLDHPGIPRYLDCFQTEAGFCMVQEYKHAFSLKVSRSFSPTEIRHLALSILEILVYLQNRIPVVIHRDIKPDNILVDDQVNVYLVDFGFARIGDGEIGVSSVVKGTLGFMPPEQLFNRQLTEASDLYSLGMTLLCLLTKTQADEIGNLVDISYQIKFQHLVPKLDLHWVKWLEKMVEPKLQDRFSNALAALQAIPSHPIYSPEIQISPMDLDFRAKRLGQRLTQTITLNNLVPEVMLKGTWDVEPHPNDPLSASGGHVWISFKQETFEGNQTECQITVDT